MDSAVLPFPGDLSSSDSSYSVSPSASRSRSANRSTSPARKADENFNEISRLINQVYGSLGDQAKEAGVSNVTFLKEFVSNLEPAEKHWLLKSVAEAQRHGSPSPSKHPRSNCLTPEMQRRVEVTRSKPSQSAAKTVAESDDTRSDSRAESEGTRSDSRVTGELVTSSKALFTKYSQCEMVRKLAKSKKHYHKNRDYFMLRPTVGLLGGFRHHVVAVLGAWEILRAYHAFKTAPRQDEDDFDALNKCARHWMNRQLAVGWNRYREWYTELIVQRQRLASALGKWLHQALSAAWNSWRQFIEQMNQQRMVAQKAVQRWRNQKLSAGFNTWWQWWVEIRSQQQAMQGALGRWQHQKLTAAWNSWMISIDAAAHYALAEGFLAKWKNQALWGAMSTWVSAHNWHQDTRHTWCNAPPYAHEWHNLHHLASVFVPWRLGVGLQMQAQREFDAMQKELIARMDARLLASPATGAKLLLDAWEDIVAKMHKICLGDPESNPYAIALRRSEKLHPSYGRPIPLTLLGLGSDYGQIVESERSYSR